MEFLILIFSVLTALSIVVLIIRVIIQTIKTIKNGRGIDDNVTNQVVDSILKNPNQGTNKLGGQQINTIEQKANLSYDNKEQNNKL